jgi:phosphoribosylamine--glycine ligase
MVFHAGTARRDGQIIASGGRVLNVTARGATLAEARARAYALVDRIDWPGGFCRRDIGWRAL